MARPTPHRLRLEPLEDRTTPVNLDPTYGANGVSAPFPDGTGPSAAAPVLLSDGAAVHAAVRANYNHGTKMVEYEVRLTRVGPDGRPDPAFGDGGTRVTPVPLVDPGRRTSRGTQTTDPSYSHGGTWQLADGGVLVRLVASRWAGGGYAEDVWVARFRPDGSLDPAYGENGLAHLPDAGKRSPVANDAFDYYLAQPDGGFIHFWSDLSLESEAVRLTPQGQLDPAFGVRRVHFGEFGAIPGTVAAATAPDGKIVLASWRRGGITQSETVVVRLNLDGSPDGSFGTNGEVRLVRPRDVGHDVIASQVVPLADGGVLLASGVTLSSSTGTPTGQLVVVTRLDAVGALDRRFDGDGQLALRVNGSPTEYAAVTAAFPRPDGDVLFVGAVPGRGEPVKFFEVTADGRLDTTFGINGTAAFDPVSGAGQTAAVLTPGGRVVTNHGRALAAFDLDAPTPPEARGVALSVYPAVPGDVTGDGRPDAVTAGRAGEEPRIRVVDGTTGQAVADELAYEPTFTGGVFTATADLDGDGRAELIVSPDVGGGARVQVFGIDGGRLVQRANFFAIEDPNFRGGARLSAGDLTGDGKAEVVFGGGPGGAPRVFVLDGALVAANRAADAQAGPVANFFVDGNSTLRGGVRVAVADLDADGTPELAAHVPEFPRAVWVKVYTAAAVVGSGGQVPALSPTREQLDAAAALFGVQIE